MQSGDTQAGGSGERIGTCTLPAFLGPWAPELTLVWKLKTVTERQTRAVMLRHSSTDVVL